MGEYGTYNGEHIKIGTCEDMYYLRADQIHLVRSAALADLTGIRFRFPFPDEDGKQPGDFDDYDRGFPVRGYLPPAGIDHSTVQFKAHVGILVSLPCPVSEAARTGEVKYHFNGFRGPARVVQQRAWAGVWATVLDCGGCGARFRLPDLSHAVPVIDALRAEGARRERFDKGSGRTWEVIADRIAAGYVTLAPDGAEVD